MEKTDVYKLIASSAIYGNLGLFIGAGFSLSVNESSYNCTPLTWSQLLEKICIENDILWNDTKDSNGKIIKQSEIKKEFLSCPEIASQICGLISQKKEIPLEVAKRILKEQVCNITSWYSNKSQREIYGPLLKDILPSWIVTTNYDMILETLIPEDSASLSPKDEFVFKKGKIPIYHLHGIRSDPENIVITNEDYINLSRPHNYRMERLAFLFSESTTLMIGYAIGDQNVLTALDWSKNVYDKQTHETKEYPHNIIQLVYTNTPKENPYETDKGIIILETNSIKETLENIIIAINEIQEGKKALNELLDSLKQNFLNPTDEEIKDFLTNTENRHLILQTIIQAVDIAISSESYLSEIFKYIWEKTKPNGAFDAYADILELFIDIFQNFDLHSFPPSIYMFFISNFERLSHFIGISKGESYKAFDIWEKYKDSIKESNKKEIKNISKWNWNIKLLLMQSGFSTN